MTSKGAAYSLSVILKLNDRLSGGLNKSVRALRAFKKESTSALKVHDKFASGLNRKVSASGYGKVNSQVKSLSNELRAATKDAARLNTTLNKKVGSNTRASGKRQLSDVGDTSPADNVLPFDQRRPRKGNRRRGMLDHAVAADYALQAGRQIKDVWRDRADSMQVYTDATTRLIRSEARLKLLGLSANELATGFAAIKRTSKDVKSVSLTDTTENLTDLYGALGDMNQAVRSLPSASRYRESFMTFFGDKFSGEQANEELRASYKALEYVGATQKGEKEMDKTLQEFIRIGASTGGRVTPSEILTMLRRAKVAGRGLSPEGLRVASTTIEDMGADTSGTSLMSLYSTLVAGVMKQPAAALYEKYGFIKKGGMEYTKAGLPKRIKPGGNILGDMLQENPAKAADKFLENLRAHGVNTDNDNELRQIMSIMFQNRNAFAYMDTLTTQRLQTQKEAKRMGVSADQYEQQRIVDVDPDLNQLRKLQEYNAQMENFRVAIGKNVLPAATSLMTAVTPYTEFIAQHPEWAKWGAGVIVFSKLTTGIVETASAIGQTVSFANRFGGAFSGYFTRARTETDKLNDLIKSVPSTKTTKFGIDSSTVGRGVSRVRGAISGLPTSIKIGVAFTAATIGADLLYESYLALQREAEAHAGLGRATTQHVSSLGKLRQQAGGRLPDDVAKTASSASFRSLNTDDDLLRSLEPNIFQRGGLGSAVKKIYRSNPYNTMGVGWAGYSRENTVAQFKQRAPELGQFPEVMKQFIQGIERMKLSGQMAPESSKEILKVAEMAFPDSFKQASQTLTVELQSLNQQITPLPSLFNQFKEPLGRSPVAINSMNIAASNFASRVNSLEIVIPTMTYQGVPMPGAAAPGAPASPAPALPRSALGSIVRADGVAELHRGNVIFPACLSRQRPGDWLEQASQLKVSGRDTSRADGGMFTDASASIHYAPHLTIQGSVTDDQIARLRGELSRQRAELETMITRATDPRRAERHRRFREQINNERA